ncbi:hypothetical protein ACLMPM_24215 [Yersinia enterocolitica]|uniref:hypothetical protein n=1 Tax=Yersinia enterocolitica TaxID=630 RepID=UPI00398CD016
MTRFETAKQTLFAVTLCLIGSGAHAEVYHHIAAQTVVEGSRDNKLATVELNVKYSDACGPGTGILVPRPCTWKIDDEEIVRCTSGTMNECNERAKAELRRWQVPRSGWYRPIICPGRYENTCDPYSDKYINVTPKNTCDLTARSNTIDLGTAYPSEGPLNVARDALVVRCRLATEVEISTNISAPGWNLAAYHNGKNMYNGVKINARQSADTPVPIEFRVTLGGMKPGQKSATVVVNMAVL